MAKQTFTTGQVLTAAQMTSLQQTAMGGGSATAKTASYVLLSSDAGATVIMNSASATTITVNTSLFSAGDTVFIQNIGAGVSTITAGTATVSTASSLALAQYDSGTLYFTAAGVSIFSKAAGAAVGGGGKVLQVIQSTIVGDINTTSTSFTSTGLTVTITPSLNTSKVLLLVTMNEVEKNSGGSGSAVKLELVRGGTRVYFAGDRIGHTNSDVRNNVGSVAMNHLDSPATTSATTYTVNFAQYSSGLYALINNSNADNTCVSSIIAMEIGA